MNASCAPAFRAVALSWWFNFLEDSPVSRVLSLVACTLLTGLNNAVEKAHRALLTDLLVLFVMRPSIMVVVMMILYLILAVITHLYLNHESVSTGSYSNA